MTGDPVIPRLITFLYGPKAGQHLDDPRLARWAQAFEDWLAELAADHKPATPQVARLAWQRLLRQVHKVPWELEPADIERHIGWMQAEDYTPSSIAVAAGMLSRFYDWCRDHHTDPDLPPGFNPARGIKRPKVDLFDKAELLTPTEVDRLLGVMRQDRSPLGLRDYAFVIARLRVGVLLRYLVELKWEQFTIEEDAVWVQWRPGGERQQLPPEVWQAIKTYLYFSGRLETISPGKYIFAPLKTTRNEIPRDQALAWTEDRPVRSTLIRAGLKLYGRLAGIPDQKLTLNALRWTAVRHQMGQSTSIDDLQSFLDTPLQKNSTRYRMGKLPQIPEPGTDSAPANTAPPEQFSIPDRLPKLFKPWDNMTHGAHARIQPPEELQEILKEDVKGLDEEVACLRTLGRLILHRQEAVMVRKELIDLMAAYSRVANWMGELFRIEQRMIDETGEEPVGHFLQVMIKMKEIDGITMTAEEARRGVLEDLRQEGLVDVSDEAVRQLAEEVAATRLVLRRTFSLAIQSQDTAELVRLTDIYGLGCVRLVKLLRSGTASDDRIEEYLAGLLYRAINEKMQEAGGKGFTYNPREIVRRIRRNEKRHR